MSWTDELRRLLRRVTSNGPEDGEDGLEGGITCREAAERLMEWLDGELAPEWEESVGIHLETCARCRPVLVFERSFREALVRVRKDARAPDRLKERILESLEDQQKLRTSDLDPAPDDPRGE